ncbi:MAG: hypothetical protein EOP61_36155, partial [Sphingomonadales bacterium]
FGRFARSESWRATVTPLASIIGSGFLICGPILAREPAEGQKGGNEKRAKQRDDGDEHEDRLRSAPDRCGALACGQSLGALLTAPWPDWIPLLPCRRGVNLRRPAKRLHRIAT